MLMFFHDAKARRALRLQAHILAQTRDSVLTACDALFLQKKPTFDCPRHLPLALVHFHNVLAQSDVCGAAPARRTRQRGIVAASADAKNAAQRDQREFVPELFD